MYGPHESFNLDDDAAASKFREETAGVWKDLTS